MGAGHRFEIVFASNDIDLSEFNSNIKDMPWTKLPYENPLDSNAISQQLLSKFSLKSLPSLVVIDEAGDGLICLHQCACYD